MDNIIVISGNHTSNCELLRDSSDAWENFGTLTIQRSHATAIWLNDVAYVVGGLNHKGELLDSIEYKSEYRWVLGNFTLPQGIRNAGAIPL